MISLERIIWNKLHIHRGDTLPFTGWAKNQNRAMLAEIFAEAGFKVGAEIGVRRGDHSLTLCEKIPGLKLYCIDPWMPYRGRRPTQERMDNYYEITKQRLSKYDATLIRKTSMDAVKDFPDNSLDFVYIDAMHEFDPVMMDIISWVPKVKVGGIVSGHDYCHGYQTGVVQAVDTYTRVHNIHNWYIVPSNYLFVNENDVPSWFWIKR